MSAHTPPVHVDGVVRAPGANSGAHTIVARLTGRARRCTNVQIVAVVATDFTPDHACTAEDKILIGDMLRTCNGTVVSGVALDDLQHVILGPAGMPLALHVQMRRAGSAGARGVS